MLLAFILMSAVVNPALAEVKEVRVAKQYGLGYLPLIVMEEQKLIEKQTKAAGLGDVKISWVTLSGGGTVNDALLSNSVDYISGGVAPLIVLWDKSKGAAKGVSALSSTPNYLNTNNPSVKSIKDFSDKDRIALPTVKVSMQAIILQMAAAREFGQENYSKLDKLTVSMKHPDAMAILLSGKSEVTGHLTSPPYMFQELDDKRVRTVLNSYEVLGGPHTFLVFTTSQAFYDKNPKTYAAVYAALEEAIAYINKNKKAAAELYQKASKTKESLDDLLKELNQPTLAYTTTPLNISKFSDFMHKTGTVKTRPNSWKDLFFPNVHGKQGS
jgi:NitT/TauT family transport system substrate-binding protein